MATFVLIPGAGSDSWYWHLVVPELEAAGHETIAIDLPCADESAGLTEYTDLVVEAIGDRDDVIVVAQSMGGLTAPLVAERVPAVRLIVLVAAMVPKPGESGGEWWDKTGWSQARREQAQRDRRDVHGEFDPVSECLHDVPADVVAAGLDHVSEQSDAPFATPWPLSAWPDVPTRFVLGLHDRFSLLTSSGGWCGSGWASSRTRSMPATFRRWRSQRTWPSCSCARKSSGQGRNPRSVVRRVSAGGGGGDD